MIVRNSRQFAIGLAIAGLLLAAAIYFLNRNAVDALTKEEAKVASTRWTEQLVAHVPDLDQIVAGKPASKEAMTYFRFIADSPDVDHFQLFDKNGEIVVDSERLDGSGPAPTKAPSLHEHNSDVLGVVANGKPFVLIEEEQEDGATIILAETYLPIIRDGKILGVASLYINQTLLASGLQQRLTLTSIIIATLSALCFAIPSISAIVQLTKRRKADAQVIYLARHDVLTGLPNRKAVEADIHLQLQASAGTGKACRTAFCRY